MNPFPASAPAVDGVGKGLAATSTAELMATVDDLLLLAEVVEAGGFRAAGARTGLTRSRLSRRIAELEERLKVCLLNRNSRRFEVTEIGQRLYERGLQIRAVTREALTLAEDSVSAPSGVLRVACPLALSQAVVGRLAIEFAHDHPRVRLCLSTTKGTDEALLEHHDLIIHPSTHRLPDSDVVARPLLTQPYCLVAAPALSVGRADLAGPEVLEGLDAIGWNSAEAVSTWRLFGPGESEAELRLPVRFAADNLVAVREAAVAGLGVARLPVATCRDDVAAGRLVILAPGWAPAPMTIYALYPSRRRLSLAGQAFIAALQQALDRLPA